MRTDIPAAGDLVNLARKFAKAVESVVLETKHPAFTIGFNSLEQYEIDKFMELQADQSFYENWNISIALAGDDGNIPARVTSRLQKLEKSKDWRALRIGDAFAKIVMAAEDAAGHRLISRRIDGALFGDPHAVSDHYALIGCHDLSKIFEPR
jgi:hypothetical protein